MTIYYSVIYERPDYLTDEWLHDQDRVSQAVHDINSVNNSNKTFGPVIYPSCVGNLFYVGGLARKDIFHICIIVSQYNACVR